jgi:hypothetical protein
MLHTIYGATVELVTAREIPVWIATGHGRIDWHYSKPKPRKWVEIEECDIWHVTAKLTSQYHDGSGKVGDMIRDGREFPASDLRATKGWGEIVDACVVARDKPSPGKPVNLAKALGGML